MKLYATVASERAGKGQGGNEYVEIDLFDGMKRHIGRFSFQEDANKEGHYVFVEDDFFRNWERLSVKTYSKPRMEEKGERQKGELCNCGKLPGFHEKH